MDQSFLRKKAFVEDNAIELIYEICVVTPHNKHEICDFILSLETEVSQLFLDVSCREAFPSTRDCLPPANQKEIYKNFGVYFNQILKYIGEKYLGEMGFMLTQGNKIRIHIPVNLYKNSKELVNDFLIKMNVHDIVV